MGGIRCHPCPTQHLPDEFLPKQMLVDWPELTPEYIRDKLIEKGTEKTVGFDLPKMVITMQTLFRSTNSAIANFKRFMGTSQRNFFAREPTIDISTKASAYKVKLVALVSANAQFRANTDHTVSELEINL